MATLGSASVPQGTGAAASTAEAPARLVRHAGIVRATHWIISLCFLALLVSGVEVLISHPRFYWGETGNDLTKAWLQIPIPSSRDLVPTGYTSVLPDQNGWSRSLHFEAAWLAVLTSLLYGIFGLMSGHFRNNLLPGKNDFSWRSITNEIGGHLRFRRPSDSDAWSYNVLQRLAYLLVIFVLFPLVIWTGLAMSPTFDAAFPATVNLLGGRQSARTLHFLVSVALVMFLLVHIAMIFVAGFWSRTRAMITGRIAGKNDILTARGREGA